MIDQEKIHKQCLSEEREERILALEQLSDFSPIPDKQQAWSDLYRLTTDEDNDIRHNAASALWEVHFQVPDKQQVWNDLHKLTYDEDEDVRYWVSDALGSAFSQMPDKQQAWNDLVKLITINEYFSVRHNAAKVLGSEFSQLPDKQQAWNDLHKLTSDEDSDVRSVSASALGSAFSAVPDKQQAWNDLHKLTSDEDSDVRSVSASALGSAFSAVPDKQQAWNDLHRLTNDEDIFVRSIVSSTIYSAFSQFPDKQQAWNDLVKLTIDENSYIRRNFAKVLGSVFSQVPDKQQAWNDLHRLINNEYSDVRSYSAFALCSAFSQVPEKEQAWNDLHRLTNDNEISVRCGVAEALSSAFSQFPDKQQAWSDLHRLTNDEDINVRAYANHSFGKVSIFQASQAEKEEDYKKEMEKAIEFFEKASQEANFRWWSNPSQFCLPFYRSFYVIIFENNEKKGEIDKYLVEAKDAIRGSKSKELLFETVENLAKALEEVQKLASMDLEVKKSELNFYRKYCDRAAELMKDTEDTAPYAIAAMRKGLPFLDKDLEDIVEGFRKKTELISKQTKGTQFEQLGDELNQNTQSLLQVRDPVGFKKQVNIIENTLRAICSKFPEDQKAEACELLKIMCSEPSIEDKIPLMNNILGKFSYQLDMTVHFNRIEEKLDKIQRELTDGFNKLDILSYEVGGKEGELIKAFSKRVHELTDKGDKEALENFLEEILRKEDVLIKEIEKSSTPLEEKEESKKSIFNVRSVIDKVKHPIKSFGKDVTKEIIVTYTAEEIVKLVVQLVSMTTLGVPIPPQIFNLLSDMVKEIKK